MLLRIIIIARCNFKLVKKIHCILWKKRFSLLSILYSVSILGFKTVLAINAVITSLKIVRGIFFFSNCHPVNTLKALKKILLSGDMFFYTKISLVLKMFWLSIVIE